MTVLVALERDDLDDVFSAADYDPAPAESQIGLRTGERMSVRDLLRATLLPSANDAAATLAVGTMGSTPAFVAEMNRRAQALGLTDTHYANPIGLDDPDNYSTAHDLARLAIRLRRYEFFRRTVDLRVRDAAQRRDEADGAQPQRRSCAASTPSTASRPATPAAPATSSSARRAATA